MFFLAEKLGKTLNEILSLSSTEISEWMAYHLSQDQEWSTNYNKELDLERQRAMSNEEKAVLIKRLLGTK